MCDGTWLACDAGLDDELRFAAGLVRGEQRDGAGAGHPAGRSGEVTSMDARAVIRTDPRDGVDAFEPNYLATVEFVCPISVDVHAGGREME